MFKIFKVTESPLQNSANGEGKLPENSTKLLRVFNTPVD